MDKIPDSIIDKFLAGKRLTRDEFFILDKFLNHAGHKEEVNLWLEQKWQETQPQSVEMSFDRIKEKVKSVSLKIKINRLFIGLVRAAAVLFIPLLAAALYLYFNQSTSTELLTLSTQKGEKTSVILPDGSKVWLNVDSKLSYLVDYGIESRILHLEGEAYFEVEKNEKLPFEVVSGPLVTKALGTRFVVSAYAGNPVVKTSLLEGSVEVRIKDKNEMLGPGKQLVFDTKKSEMTVRTFDERYELAWQNNQLVFRLTPFYEVIEELEKWFDVTIEFDSEVFKSETLTVRFEANETLETILNVIARANGFTYTIKDKNITIRK